MNAVTPPAIALRAAKRAFLARFDHFVAASGRKPGGVSAALFGSNRKVEALRGAPAPADVNVETLAQADEWLSAMAAAAGISLPDGALAGEPPRPNGEISAAGARDV